MIHATVAHQAPAPVPAVIRGRSLRGRPIIALHLGDDSAPRILVVGAIHGEGVELHACRNTMEAQKLSLDDLLPGFAVAEKGAVVKLAELQAEGWAYLRP